MPDDEKVFADEFVPNIQSAPYHSKWLAANANGDAPKWSAFRDAVLAYTRGDTLAPPSMATKYGRALVAAGKLHMSVIDLGAVWEPEPTPPPPSGSATWWAANSPINTPIGANPTVLVNYGQGNLSGLPGVGFNSNGWGVAIFENNSGARRTISNPNWKIDNVPIPVQWSQYHAAMAAIGDQEKHHVVVDTDRVFNIYNANLAYTSCGAMGLMRAKTVSSGFWNNNLGPWLGRSSGFCSATGTVRKAEVDAGLVPHALSFGWPSNRIHPSTVVPPAVTTDGTAGSGGTPMGSRIQLNPSLTDTQLLATGIATYYLPVLKAMQTYGGYVCESTDWMTIYAESWNDSGQCVWPSGWWPAASNLIQHLRIVQSPAAPVLDDRTVFNQPYPS